MATRNFWFADKRLRKRSELSSSTPPQIPFLLDSTMQISQYDFKLESFHYEKLVAEKKKQELKQGDGSNG